MEIYDKVSSTWVSKQDVGTTGISEKEKSQASDSFKRACFNWGIGRELYTAPFIWLPAGKAAVEKKGDKFYCNDHFSVDRIEYNEDREIDCLVIVNAKGKTVYELKQGKVKKQEQETGNGITGAQMEQLQKELYKKVMAALAKTKSMEAA